MISKEKNLLDVMLTILKHVKFISKFVFITTLIALLISLIWPKTYKSSVQFFPPPNEKLGLSGLFNSIMQASPTTSKLSSEAMLIILRSRNLKEKTIKKFSLDQVYDQDIPEYVLLEFENNILINEVREGGFGFNPVVSVEFSFYDREPERAEAVTSFYIQQLDSIVKQFNYERLFSNYKSLEERYNQNLKDLKMAEEALSEFQKKNGIFKVETQLETMVQKLADLKAQSIELEIQVNVLKNTATPENKTLQQLITQKNELDKAYKKLIEKSDKPLKNEVFQPLSLMPDLGLKFARLYREVTIQSKVLEVVYPQFEQLKLQVNSEPLGIQIVDYAKLPTYKDKPKRIYIVLAGFIFAMFFSLLIVYVKETISDSEKSETEDYQKWVSIKKIIDSYIFFWKKNGN